MIRVVVVGKACPKFGTPMIGNHCDKCFAEMIRNNADKLIVVELPKRK